MLPLVVLAIVLVMLPLEVFVNMQEMLPLAVLVNLGDTSTGGVGDCVGASTTGTAPTPRGNHATVAVHVFNTEEDSGCITVAIVGGSSTYSEESMRCLTYCNDVRYRILFRTATVCSPQSVAPYFYDTIGVV